MVKLPRGIFVEEIRIGPKSIEGVNTNIAGFLGETEKGPNSPTLIKNWSEFKSVFGGCFGIEKYLPHAVYGFFLNGGQKCYIERVLKSNSSSAMLSLSDYTGTGQNNGLAGLAKIDEISIVYAPNAQAIEGLTDALIDHCENLKDRFAIIDSKLGQNPSNLTKPRNTSYAALYYPWINVADPQNGQTRLVPPGGHITGIYAYTDAAKGVHKSPSNQEVKGAASLEYAVTKAEQDRLTPEGINCIRAFQGRGMKVWGARTLCTDTLWKYVNIRRLFIYLEKSIAQGIQWSAFEPCNEKTWAKVTQAITEFLTRTWATGMLMGAKAEEAFFVKCNRTTMVQNDIDNHRLIVEVGVAAMKPAEFMIFRVVQSEKDSETFEG